MPARTAEELNTMYSTPTIRVEVYTPVGEQRLFARVYVKNANTTKEAIEEHLHDIFIENRLSANDSIAGFEIITE